MKVLYNWLREFVDVTAPAADLRARLALAGTDADRRGVEVSTAEQRLGRAERLADEGRAAEAALAARE